MRNPTLMLKDRLNLKDDTRFDEATIIVLGDRLYDLDERTAWVFSAPYEDDEDRARVSAIEDELRAEGYEVLVRHTTDITEPVRDPRAEAEHLLNQLPDTVRKVAQYLDDQGFYATSDATSCPVTQYLRREVPEVDLVTPAAVHFRSSPGSYVEPVPLPMPVRSFVEVHDAVLRMNARRPATVPVLKVKSVAA